MVQVLLTLESITLIVNQILRGVTEIARFTLRIYSYYFTITTICVLLLSVFVQPTYLAELFHIRFVPENLT